MRHFALVTLVFSVVLSCGLLAAQEREGKRRSAEADAGRRESAEAKAGVRRSAEAERGPRKSPEAERGARRSTEAERGARKSPEADASSRRSAESDRGTRRSAEAARDGDNPLGDFKPKTEREAVLYKLLMQLRREVALLRQQVEAKNRGDRPRDGDGSKRDVPRDRDARRDGDAKRDRDVPRRDGDASRRDGDAGRRDGDAPRDGDARRPSKASISKYQKQFKAYDKNNDKRISLEERIAMKNYEVKGERLLNERLYHLHEDMNRDGGVSLEEFVAARTRKGQRWLQFQLLSIADDGSIKVQARGEGSSASDARSIKVESKAIVTSKGKETKLGSLKSGQPVFLFMSHDQKSAIGVTQR